MQIVPDTKDWTWVLDRVCDECGYDAKAVNRPDIPSTVRHNVGDPYRGCLNVDVPDSRELYWRIKGMMRGIGRATGWERDASM